MADDIKVRIGLESEAFANGLDRVQTQVRRNIEDMSSHFSKLQVMVSGIAAGALTVFVKQGIDAADSLSKLSIKTGATVETLAGFDLAAKLSDTSLEAIAKSSVKLSEQLVKNGETFKALGINTKDPTEAMIQLADVFVGMEDPAQRAALANKLFGKSGIDLLPMLMDGSDALRGMIEQGKQYNPVTEDMAAQAAAFNDKLTLVDESVTTASTTIAGKMLPILNTMADQFQQTSTDSDLLTMAADSLTVALQSVASIGLGVKSTLFSVGDAIGGIAAAAGFLMQGQYDNALNVMDGFIDKSKQRGEQLSKDMYAIWNPQMPAQKDDGGNKPKDKRGQDFVSKLVVNDGASSGKADNSAQKAADEAMKLNQMILAEQGRVSAQYINLEIERIKGMAQLGQISASNELQAQAALQATLFELEKKSAIDAAELVKNKPLEYQKAMDKIADIQRKHDLDMQKQQVAYEVAQRAEIAKQTESRKKEFDQMFSPMTNAFEKSANAVISGNLTLTKAVRQMAQSVALEYANMGIKTVVEWAKNEVLKTQATAAGAVMRSGIEKTAASESMLTGSMTAIKSIMNSAWETLANVYTSISSIPVVGPYLAPVLAAGAFATVAAVAGNIASASGGYDIPYGVNPMTQLHQEEMVLPAHIADPLRGIIADYGAGYASKSNQQARGDTINIHAMDARSFQRFLGDNASALPPAMQKLARQFVKV